MLHLDYNENDRDLICLEPFILLHGLHNVGFHQHCTKLVRYNIINMAVGSQVFVILFTISIEFSYTYILTSMIMGSVDKIGRAKIAVLV